MLCPCTTLVRLRTGSFLESFGVIPLSSIDLVSFVFLPPTPTTGVFDCFCVCAIWLQFAFCKKEVHRPGGQISLIVAVLLLVSEQVLSRD